jgi:predicted esterase
MTKKTHFAKVFYSFDRLMPLMPVITYFQLINQAMSLYREGELKEAYDLVTSNGESVRGNPAQVMNFRYCIASKLGEKELALKLMRQAVVEKGYWWGYDYLIGDDDLENLRDTPEFQSLAAICRTREIEAKKRSLPSMKILQAREQSPQCPRLLMALHGNGDNAKLTETYWLPCLREGFDLALPQSSQTTSWEAFTWEDLNRGLIELIAHLDRVQCALAIHQEDAIIAGFSGGARLALHAVLKGAVSPGGLILIAPWLPDLDSWGEALETIRAERIKCWIVCGDQDSDCLEGSKKLGSMMELDGIDTQLDIIKGLDHDYPVDFGARLSLYLNKHLNQIRERKKRGTEHQNWA